MLLVTPRYHTLFDTMDLFVPLREQHFTVLMCLRSQHKSVDCDTNKSGFTYRLCNVTQHISNVKFSILGQSCFLTELADVRKHFATVKCCISAQGHFSLIQNPLEVS